MSLVEAQNQINENIANESLIINEDEDPAATEIQAQDIQENINTIVYNNVLAIDKVEPINIDNASTTGPDPINNYKSENDNIDKVPTNVRENSVKSANVNIDKIKLNIDNEIDVPTNRYDPLNHDNSDDHDNLNTTNNEDVHTSDGVLLTDEHPNQENNLNLLGVQNKPDRDKTDLVDDKDDNKIIEGNTPENDAKKKQVSVRDDDSSESIIGVETGGNKNDDELKVVHNEVSADIIESGSLKEDITVELEQHGETTSKHRDDSMVSGSNESSLAVDDVMCSENLTKKHEDKTKIMDKESNITEFQVPTSNINNSQSLAEHITGTEFIEKEVCMDVDNTEKNTENVIKNTNIDKELSEIGESKIITVTEYTQKNSMENTSKSEGSIDNENDYGIDVDNADKITVTGAKTDIVMSDTDEISMDLKHKSERSDIGESHRNNGIEPIQEDSTESKSACDSDKVKENDNSVDVDNAEQNIITEPNNAYIVHNTNEIGTETTPKDSLITNTNEMNHVSIGQKDIMENSIVENTHKETEVKKDEFNTDKISERCIAAEHSHNKDSIESDTDVTAVSDRIQTVSKTIKGLSNNLDILSDADDDCRTLVVTTPQDKPNKERPLKSKEIMALEDDDDLMVIDEDVKKYAKEEMVLSDVQHDTYSDKDGTSVINEHISENDDVMEIGISEEVPLKKAEDDVKLEDKTKNEKNISEPVAAPIKSEEKSLIALNFMKNVKVKICDMTRTDLEDFCLMKIVEGLVDRGSLSEIKGQIKTLVQTVDDWKKKAMVLNKQNKDLQVILTNIQEEQSKMSGEVITPLRITRSVGMQVLMTNNKSAQAANSNRVHKRITYPNSNAVSKNILIKNGPQQPKNVMKPPIPVPRLVPALNNSPSKPTIRPQLQNSTITSSSGAGKVTPIPNGVRLGFSPNKPAEKRSLGSVSIDLTDDEPPVKQMTTNKGTQPVRLAPKAANNQNSSNPRQVYIPINGSPGNGNIRPGQTITFSPNAQPRLSNPIRAPNARANSRVNHMRHPAPLPHAYRQAQPPHWKYLPPAPDLKISKVENGIVISWKMQNGFKEDFCEEIASYQLFAYQETSVAPSTMLWKKIGDVKALPLPMACTLTQFMSGYKYYFAVRAVDIRSRLGPFSLPGSILLLNK